MANDGNNSEYAALNTPKPSEWLEKQQSGSRKSKFLVRSFPPLLCFVRSEEEWVGCWGNPWRLAKFGLKVSCRVAGLAHPISAAHRRSCRSRGSHSHRCRRRRIGFPQEQDQDEWKQLEQQLHQQQFQ